MPELSPSDWAEALSWNPMMMDMKQKSERRSLFEEEFETAIFLAFHFFFLFCSLILSVYAESLLVMPEVAINGSTAL